MGTLRPPSTDVLLRQLTDDPAGPGYLAAASGLVRLYGQLTLRSWDNPDASTFLGPTDEGPPSAIFPQHDAIFWSSGYASPMKHKVWTADAGSRDFLSFGTDAARGAADLGTDGKDMVWVEGAGRPNASERFTTVTARTAPFTSDPTLIVPRTLRSDLSAYGVAGSDFVVGCGYAARNANSFLLADGGTTTALQFIRLADGHDAHRVNPTGAGWQWTQVLAITCDEVFVLGHLGYDFNITRIPMNTFSTWRSP